MNMVLHGKKLKKNGEGKMGKVTTFVRISDKSKKSK